MILSLLQTEINYDNAYHKMYHHISNLLVHYLVKWTRMYWPTLLAWFRNIKDVTVKQVTCKWNVTDMDKINIVRSQVVLEMSFFSMDTHSMSSLPLVNSLVENRLFKTAPVSIHPHYGFVCGRHDAAWQPRSHNPQDWVRSGLFGGRSLDIRKFGVSWRSSSTVARMCTVCWCTVLLEQSRYLTLCVSLAAVWRHYDVVK